MFSKVLVANRGLIQANCVRAIQELGAKAITVFEEGDKNNAGVRNADEAYELKATSHRAYADIDQLVNLAVTHDVDAVVSGYGFLAQNAEFTRKLRQRGIVTIAPELEGKVNLSDRPAIKEQARELGFHVLPGSETCIDFQQVKEAARTVGYPLLVKAVHGYGGKGLRLVRRPQELKSSYEYVLSQCEKYAMNSQEVLVEKYFDDAHHIEFPVLRDDAGNVVVFPEQWCSVQRRFQKVLVETPSRVITNEKRSNLESVIKLLMNKLNVRGFASVVFLVVGDIAYFLKVNGYIQPFYTATSQLTGIDLLKEQIRIFSGDPMKVRQEQVNRNGHVVSVSICAEDPYNDFRPSPGKIDRFYLPFGQGINVQTNVFSGDMVSTFYDPTIAKIIVRDAGRKAAIQKMQIAIDDCFIDGIKTNLPLLKAILHSDEFRTRRMNISFITKEINRMKIIDNLKTPEEQEIAALVAALAFHNDSNNQQILESADKSTRVSLWNSAARWLNRKTLDF